ncbi:hypothetical protein FACS189459_4080 [Bacilli bacterium]|nr:hypothetical protein FACS189459_4080 [Bacilli bacterium]
MKTKSIKKNILLLAIETSCDDTSISIFKNDKMLSLATLSTIKQFKKYGGIVPEIAARGHEESLIKVYLQAIKKAKIKPQELDYIAYTSEPGLPGSLHVGKTFAKALGFLLGIECVPINHMLGHVFSFAINDANKIKFPFICLVASGGHTTLYLFNGIEDYKILNETTDDPIGETLDKIGRMLKLEYPGGISIDTQYKPDKNNLKLIGHHSPQTNFSFSGLKTHILNQINTLNMKNKDIDKVLIGSSCLK